MSEREPQSEEISSLLAEIRQKLRSSKMVRNLFPQERQSLLTHRPKEVARSEFFVSEKDLRLVLRKVNRVRNWLFEHGENFTLHPDCEEWLHHQWRTSRECQKLYWYQDDQFGVKADRSALEETIDDELDGYKLLFRLEDQQEKIKELLVIFGWERNFQIEILFADLQDPNRILARYPSLKLPIPIKEMTPEEAKIVSYYLDQFLRFHSS